MALRNDLEEQKLEVLNNIEYQLELFTSLYEITISKTIDVDKAKETITKQRQDPKKFIKIYNSCNGKMSQAEIAKKFKIDAGNFSRAIDEWRRNGLIVELNKEGKVYPKALVNLK